MSSPEEPLPALAFRDFVPRQLRAPHFGLSTEAVEGEYETLAEALAAANAWRRESGARVIQVETVVLPNLWAKWEHGSADPALGAGSRTPVWYQFIRLWYEVED